MYEYTHWKNVYQILLYVFEHAVNVHMPRERITQLHQNYGFVEFMGEDDADYAIKIMNMIKIYGKPIRVNKVTGLIIVSIRVVCDNYTLDLNHTKINIISLSRLHPTPRTLMLEQMYLLGI